VPELKPSTLYSNANAHGYLDESIEDPHQRAVVQCVIQQAQLCAGDHIIEIGAGSGRYTRLLLDLGLHVTATEPDDALRAKLEALRSDTCTISSASAGVAPIPEDVVGVVGFHVLHHLNAHTIEALEHTIAQAQTRDTWRGAAFLEPNPLNPLYLLQILASSSMRVSEEFRLWAWRFHRRGPGTLHVPAHVGVVPPAIARRTGISPAKPFRMPGRWCPWSAYRIVADRQGAS
jgi:hypothetical protein